MSASCYCCKSLDLSFYRTGHGDVPPQIDLGTWDTLIERVDCPLCGLVLGFLDRASPSAAKHSEKHILLKPWEVGIEIYYEDNEDTSTVGKSHNRLLGELSVYPESHSSSPNEKPGGPIVCASVLKKFLHFCETKHGTLCANGSRAGNGRRCVALLLLDLEKKCLVSVTSSLGYRYIALSYVWGGTKTLQATRENLPSLMQENSLSILGDKIASVIRDAIAVASMMGERFLWVDSLCIVQDDPNWKHLQISQMDLIYNQSILTIVAASGTNANDGLPGINQNPRLPTTAHVQDVVLARPTLYPDDILSNTAYETRAWTLQEKTLSRRCIFFSNEQVFFRCNAGIHPENELEPLIKLTATATRARANSVNPLSRLISTSKGGNNDTVLPWDTAFCHYSFLLSDYTGRQLSFPSDILLAFEGLGAVFSSTLGGRLLCGLPESVFDESLGWMQARGINLTRRRSAIHITHSAEIQAPSWSWCGWEGRVEHLLLPNNFLVQGRRNIIQLFELHTPDGVTMVQRLSGNKKTKTHGDGSGTTPSTLESRLLPRNACHNMPFRTHLLVFSAPILDIFLFDLEQVPINHHRKIPWRSWLLDRRGYQCGVLFDNIPTRALVQQQEFGFIALSYVHCNESTEARMIDSRMYTTSGSSGRNFDQIMIILVEWKRDKNGCEWAERVSLGLIYEGAWIISKPQEKVIKLA